MEGGGYYTTTVGGHQKPWSVAWKPSLVVQCDPKEIDGVVAGDTQIGDGGRSVNLVPPAKAVMVVGSGFRQLTYDHYEVGRL